MFRYPLYLRGKERLQFNYAMWLLNKNIAQFRWFCGIYTPNLKATLPNLLALLEGRHFYPELMRCNKAAAEEAEASCEEQRSEIDTNCKLNPRDTSSNPIFCPNQFTSPQNISDPILDVLRQECMQERSYTRTTTKKHTKNLKLSETGPGLSQVLAIPEAFLNQQITSVSFRSYMAKCDRTGICEYTGKETC